MSSSRISTEIAQGKLISNRTGRKLSEFLEDVGLQYILKSELHWARRAKWIILYLIALGLMIYQIQERTAHYWSRPSTTLISIDENDKLTFPAITMCNTNWMRKSYVIEKNLELLYYNTVKCAHTYSLCNSNDTNVHLSDYYESCCRYSYPNIYSYDNIKHGSHQFNRLMALAEFQNDDLYMSSRGNLSYSPALIPRYGQCYTVNDNAHTPMTTHVSGVESGIDAFLNLESSEYEKRRHYSGITVLLHSTWDIPYEEGDPISISQGHMAHIKLKLKIYNFHPTVTGCVLYKEVDGKLNYFSPPYTKAKCVKECAFRLAYESCGCIPYYWPRFQHFLAVGMKECATMREFLCFGHFLKHLTSSGTVAAVCNNCPRECHTTQYEWDLQVVSKESWIHICDFVQLATDGNGSSKCVEEDLILLRIFFKTMMTETMSQELSYNEWALLSDIGGSMGIALGCTLLTFYNVLDYLLFDVLISRCKR